MPLFPRFSLGMEMNDSLFKLVEMKKGLRRTRLTQYVVHPLLPVWQEERTAVDREELIQSVRDALSGRRLRTRQVHLTLSNRHVTTGVWNIPEMRPSRMRRWIEKKVLPEWDLPMTTLISIISRSVMSGRKGITGQWWWRSPPVLMWSRW